jgi:hypothetical protein
VTERPWSLAAADLVAAREAGLDDAGILHVILQASLFGHLNRIADAVDVPADYPDRFGAPHVEPATPAYLRPVDPPAPRTGAISLALRDGANDLLHAWSVHALDRDEPHLDRRRRAVIRHAVALALGDGSVPASAPLDDFDHALISLADLTTLAPWRLGPVAYARVRELGLATDAQVFDAVATASSCTAFSRIAVAVAGLAR